MRKSSINMVVSGLINFLFREYRIRQVNRLSEAIRCGETDAVRELCSKRCVFSGFSQDIKSVNDLCNLIAAERRLSYYNKSDIFICRNRVLIRRSKICFKVAEVLKISGYKDLEVRYEFYLGKISSVSVSKYSDCLSNEDREIWDGYVVWLKSAYGDKVDNYMEDPSYAIEYVRRMYF